MRNMSFALTKEPMLARTKRVTRRLGWEFLKVGDRVQPVEKCMGLKPGEKIVRIGPPIIITELRREPLDALTKDVDYGWVECALEGFAGTIHQFPTQFVSMFCNTHRGCTPQTVVTRIAFEFTS